jgi:hypothetical protein
MGGVAAPHNDAPESRKASKTGILFFICRTSFPLPAP